MLNTQAARELIEKILTNTGAANGLPSDVREEMIRQMLQELNAMFNGELLDALNDAQASHVERLLDTGRQGDIEGYLAGQGINVAELNAAAFTRFKADYQ